MEHRWDLNHSRSLSHPPLQKNILDLAMVGLAVSPFRFIKFSHELGNNYILQSLYYCDILPTSGSYTVPCLYLIIKFQSNIRKDFLPKTTSLFAQCESAPCFPVIDLLLALIRKQV